jgi:hypothetical protein
VVERSPHHSKVKGSSSASAAHAGGEESGKKLSGKEQNFQLLVSLFCWYVFTALGTRMNTLRETRIA